MPTASVAALPDAALGPPGAAPGAAVGQVIPVAAHLDPAAPLPTESELRALAAQTIETVRLARSASSTGAAGPLGADVVGGLGISVRDWLTGEELYANGATRGLTPASTVKILTAAAALATLGSETVLATRAVLSDVEAGHATVTLVAGGDTTLGPDAGDPGAVLGRAGMGDLARAAATELRRSGAREVSVALDDSLFTGPQTYPDWGWYSGTTWGAPTTPLAIMDGRAGAAFDEPTFVPDPALTAAEHFAALLAEAAAEESLTLPSVSVATSVTRAVAPAGALELARVDSAPMRQLVAHMLRHSDNTLAEALGRVTAVARGLPGSFEGCAQGVGQVLEDLGVPTANLRLDDCSGLSHGSRVSAATLTSALALAGGSREHELSAVAGALPVGALQGTVTRRFTEAPAAGNVRAKTGTLTGVTSLAGVVQTTAGRELAFAVIANPEPAIGSEEARQAMDEFVQGLAALD
jgi:D-alanyl-D-alanine carboxypeptidase/D-alanyl-D-alanine-endopeptidase (penicillin-binding protein 4)